MYKLLITLVFAILITSCGWHLRGYQAANSTGSINKTVGALSLSADDIYTPLYRSFKTDYEKRRIDLTNTTDKPQLKLLRESTATRILSLNTELDPAESEIMLTIRYQITFPGQPTQFYNLPLYRTYTQNKNRTAARDNEREKLLDEMRHQAAEQILNQIHTMSHSQPAQPVRNNSVP